MLVLKGLLLIDLLLIFYQDLKSRSVYWFLFPLLIFGLIFVHLEKQGFNELWQSALINLAFLALQLLIITIYFSIKYKKWTNITGQLLGTGDVLFLISIAFYLSVLNYLFFYVISLVLVLLFWAVLQKVSTKKSEHIPLAGLQAIIFAVFLTVDWAGLLNMTNDDLLMNLIAK